MNIGLTRWKHVTFIHFFPHFFYDWSRSLSNYSHTHELSLHCQARFSAPKLCYQRISHIEECISIGFGNDSSFDYPSLYNSRSLTFFWTFSLCRHSCERTQQLSQTSLHLHHRPSPQNQSSPTSRRNWPLRRQD